MVKPYENCCEPPEKRQLTNERNYSKYFKGCSIKYKIEWIKLWENRFWWLSQESWSFQICIEET